MLPCDHGGRGSPSDTGSGKMSMITVTTDTRYVTYLDLWPSAAVFKMAVANIRLDEPDKRLDLYWSDHVAVRGVKFDLRKWVEVSEVGVIAITTN